MIETIIKNLRWWAFHCEKGGQECYAAPSLRDAANILENMNKRGKWILEREPDGKPYCLHCSICDDDFSRISITTAYPYCPHCGTKMDLEE